MVAHHSSRRRRRTGGTVAGGATSSRRIGPPGPGPCRRRTEPLMAPLNPDVMAWMRAHHATISRCAALDRPFGQPRPAPAPRRRRGCWCGSPNRSYGLGAVELDERAVAAALCAARPELVVAGPTAGRLWGLRRSPRDGLVHVIAPPASHRREPWVKAYRTALIDPEDVVTHPDGLRLTSPSRTVVDLTRYVDPFALTSIISTISSGLCSETAMERTAAPAGHTGPVVGPSLSAHAGEPPPSARRPSPKASSGSSGPSSAPAPSPSSAST